MTRFTLHCALTSGMAVAAMALAAPAGAATCVDLVNLKIAPNQIGLPTSGATISSAQMQTVPASPLTPDVKRDFCKVLGSIAPVDPNAPPINFEVNLPTQWNGKAVQYGGGGSNGTLITGLGPLRDARRDTPVPIVRGFATWGTDAGHQNEKLPEPRAFGLNDESNLNMAYGAYKKTHDAARLVARAFYDRAPAKIYYYGGSQGGREALMMAQRFPADYDGIVSVVPTANYAGEALAWIKLGALQRAGGWTNPEKVKVIAAAVNAACDKVDGLADGVVSAYEKCLNLFDPKTLRCPNGADTGNTCLSDAQIEAVKFIHSPFQYPFPLKNGVTSFPGYPYGSELGPDGLVTGQMGPEAPQYPIASARTQSEMWANSSTFVSYFFARDPKFDPLQFSPEKFTARIREISDMYDTTDPDLSPFLAHGGKLIIKSNVADYRRNGYQEITYYKSVVAKMGQQKADQFVRLLVTPGVSHVGDGRMSDGATVPDRVDLLGALDGWVETGKSPDALVQLTQETKAPFQTVSSRPMCAYPAYPHYDGKGDVNDAASFACAKQ